jgi:uncharacterized damage-inducible protein DinB
MKATDQGLLEALLDSWQRNNTIMLNLLHVLPESSLGIRVMEDSPTIAASFTHVHYIRLVHVYEDAPEFARDVPEQEWLDERDKERITQMLVKSADAVRDAVKGRLEAGKEMELHYDHPVLMLQHLIWHEGYHHGQIKLALKLADHPISDEEVGKGTWGVWMGKTRV